MMNDSEQLPTPERVIQDALLSLDIKQNHGRACQQEVENWLNNDGIDDPDLIDLVDLPFITIDNPDSRDLDQALFIERENSGYRVRYALADASYYIRPDSALFAEALTRGTTYYTPLLAVPMLPTALSEGLISLNPAVTRRSLVFDLQVTEDAIVKRCTVQRCRIRSQAKLSYGHVQSWLDSGKNDSEPYHPSLRLLAELGELLIKAGERRGVIQFDRSESVIDVTGTPRHFEARVRERFATERYNEQISLLCNMQGAELLLGFAGVSDVIQAVFRVHEAPLKKNLKKLKNTFNEFAERDANPEKWRWEDHESLAEYVNKLPGEHHHQRRVRALQRQIMRAQQASVYRPEPGEHHALKACSYARFSSPMREVVGIFTHKELLEALDGSTYQNDQDQSLREQVIESANAARQRQRQLEKAIEFAALFSVFSRDLQQSTTRIHEGTVMGMRSDRLYINLDDMALDIKVFISDLEEQFDCTYELSEIIARPLDPSQPQWYLGQCVGVSIKAFDSEKRRFRFLLKNLERL
jgi:ribonuclease R